MMLLLSQDKEVEFGGAPPRVLGLDDYFMTEVEKTEKDPDTGKRVKKKVGIPTQPERCGCGVWTALWVWGADRGVGVQVMQGADIFCTLGPGVRV